MEPPKNDEDIVLRFRGLAAELVPLVPDDADPTSREKRSRVISMALRAAVEDLTEHVGPNMKSLTYVVGYEVERAVLALLERLQSSARRN